jgi:glycosyltransferase involved in cell wall biosynthesis
MKTNNHPQKVAIYQHRLLHYREKLFEDLRLQCADNNIDLFLIHGNPSKTELTRQDTSELSWSTPVKNKFLRIGNTDLLWQPRPSYLADMDLVIVMQESRIISNYPIILQRKNSKQKIAYWGHGANFQSKAPGGIREKWKKFWLNSVDWWFSYTEVTTEILIKGGYPEDQITTLNNAVDTLEFADTVNGISQDEATTIRSDLRIEPEAKIAVFCGSLYPDKKIDLMLSSCDLIKRQVPSFELLVLGDGPSASDVKGAAQSRPWIHFMGVVKGKRKAELFRIADVMLNPGLLGLHILDSFSIGLPLVSTRHALHSPEIAYLENNKNGILVENDVSEDYAAAVSRLFNDPLHYSSISSQALMDGKKYTLENMVANFSRGIAECLSS